jgi:predicted nucleic acid-binding protein
MDAIADTGYLVALLRREDEYHHWARDLATTVTLPLLTCEAVLAETAFHLRSASHVLALLQRGGVRVAFDCAAHVQRLHDLAIQYADRSPDLADICLIRMSELFPSHTVVTVDEEDFRVYRRNRREAIPILCPPR